MRRVNFANIFHRRNATHEAGNTANSLNKALNKYALIWSCSVAWRRIIQGCTHPLHQSAVTTKFCTLAHNICESSVWMTLVVFRSLRWLLNFWEICTPLVQSLTNFN
jgi:hypothetical protein